MEDSVVPIFRARRIRTPAFRATNMSTHRSPNLADLPHRVRDQVETFAGNWKQWRSDVREDPSLLWRSAVIRIPAWIIIGLALYFGLRGLLGGIFSGPTDVGDSTPLATLYVVCTNPDCAHHFQTRRPIDFADWPIACPVCNQMTVQRARLCPKCRHWVAIAPGDGSGSCPHCAAVNPVLDQSPAESGAIDPDDIEDGW